MPEEVRLDFGRRLNLAQRGMAPPSTKPWKGFGSSVLEMVREFDSDTFRAVYTIRFSKAVYVLHAFQKKSPKGRKTDARDVEAVESALRGAEEHYAATYGNEADQ